MKRPLCSFLLLTLSLGAGLAPGSLHAAKTSSANESKSLDPKALDGLKRMSATLGSAKAFTYKSKNIIEVPAETGQFVTLFSTGTVALKRPNMLRAKLGGDAPAFDFFYDGTTVSAYAPGTHVYSRSKAPATIDGMLSGLQAETGIRFASAPLLFANPYEVLTRDLSSAVVVGPSMVDGAACEHLAFRAPGVNWEIWIESNSRALPRRLAVTFTDRINFPRTLIDLSSWNLHPWLGAGDFAFRPPSGAEEIPFAAVLKSADR
jgi:hypothetical protein